MPDAVVVGAGTMGSAACIALARRGVGVVAIDRFAPPHTLGSHHGHSRIFRHMRYEPPMVALMRRSEKLWEALQRESGDTLLHPVGVLYAAPGSSAMLRRAAEVAEAEGIGFERLTRPELAVRFPQFDLPADYAALLEPSAGYLDPEKAVAAMAASARAAGADIRTGERVVGWTADGDGVRVTTDRETYRARAAVFAAGPWTSQILTDLGVPLVVTRQTAHWVGASGRHSFRAPGFPCWTVDPDDGTTYYGFPEVDEPPGLKLARHGGGTPTDPDRADRAVTGADLAQIREFLRRFLPAADGPFLHSSVCLYTNSPDGEFIVDVHPRHGNVALACGFSGHGFKFAPVIGEVLAEAVIGGRLPPEAEHLSLSRFRT